jgi:hypothetical protein
MEYPDPQPESKGKRLRPLSKSPRETTSKLSVYRMSELL